MLGHTRAQPLTSADKLRVHRFEHLRYQSMRLQQTTEIEAHGLIRNRIKTTEPGGRARRSDLAQTFFHALVAQCIPLLQPVDTYDRLLRAAWVRTIRLDLAQQCVPGHHFFHLDQEDLAPGLFALAPVLGVAKCRLAGWLLNLCRHFLSRTPASVRHYPETCSERPLTLPKQQMKERNPYVGGLSHHAFGILVVQQPAQPVSNLCCGRAITPTAGGPTRL